MKNVDPLGPKPDCKKWKQPGWRCNEPDCPQERWIAYWNHVSAIGCSCKPDMHCPRRDGVRTEVKV